MNRPDHSRATRRGAKLCLAKICLAAMLGVASSGCQSFKIDVGTEEAIKLDPIKFEPIDINMRVDIYQHTGSSKSTAQTTSKTEAKAIEDMRNRMDQINILKNSRWVGENHLGHLSIRHLPAGADGTWTQEIVTAENADRDIVMMEKAKRDNTPIEAIRTQQWQNNLQNAWEGVLIEIEEKENKYRWVQKPKTGSGWITPQNPAGVDQPNPVEDTEPDKEEN
jgi:hypothetical protein